MTTKHTPGPWSLNIEDGRAEVCVDGERLTDPYIGDGNAHLIAAAPDMLAALKAAVTQVHLQKSALPMAPDVQHVFDQCCAAIAKAEGKQP